MRAHAGLHADPTRRQIGEPGLHLATRPLLPQHEGTALILAKDVERVLADIDADYGGGKMLFLLGKLMHVVGAPSPHPGVAGGGRGATAPVPTRGNPLPADTEP